jgi:hypothetical protein
LRSPLRRRLAAVLLLPAAAGVLGLSSCGGGGAEGNATDLLDKAFARQIESADLDAEARLQVKGSSALDSPVRIRARGPYRANKGKLPSVDLDLEVSAGGGGQTVQTGYLSTGDRAFVKFQDVYYEQPRARVRRTNRQLGERRGKGGSLEALGLDPRSWLRDATEQGHEKVGGVETTRVSGKLDVRNVLRDLNDFVKRSGQTLGASGQVPPPLTNKQIDKVAEVVKDPTFEINVGNDDDVIRRVAARIELQVPERDRSSVGGIEGGTVEFSIEFHDVGGDQKIEAPARARPLSDLTGSLGAGALGGLGGGGGSSGGIKPPATSTAPDTDALKRYADCLDKAKSNDTAALQRCAKLLR